MEKQKNNYYVLVWDSLWENPLSSKPNYLAVFLYILSHAYKKDTEIIINNEKTVIKRGQWLGSVRKIADQFGLSTGTVFYILHYLKVEHIIEHKTTKRFTLFTVINYDKYQPQLEHKIENKLKTNKKQIETKDKDNKANKDISNTLKSITREQAHGNEKVNYLLEVFKKLLGKSPIDKYPRQVAWNFSQNICSTYKKKTGKMITFDRFQKIVDWLFEEYLQKDFAEKTLKLETVRLHSRTILEQVLEGGEEK